MLFFSSRVAYISNLMIILLYIDGISGSRGKPEGPQCVIYSLTCIHIRWKSHSYVQQLMHQGPQTKKTLMAGFREVHTSFINHHIMASSHHLISLMPPHSHLIMSLSVSFHLQWRDVLGLVRHTTFPSPVKQQLHC